MSIFANQMPITTQLTHMPVKMLPTVRQFKAHLVSIF